VLKRWAPWLYPVGHNEYDGPRAEPGEVLWFKRADNGVEEVVPAHTSGARSRTFIPALAQDNPHLSAEYLTNLDMLDALSRAQLKHGDWMARSAAGAYFKRHWFADSFVNSIPTSVVMRVRYWDRAATAAGDPNAKDAAWTAGVRMSRTDDGLFWVEHVERGQWSPGEVERVIKSTAETDAALGTRVVLERDPAQAGKFEAFHYARLLAGFDVRTVPPQGDKITRAKPVSAQAEAGNLRLVRGRWNEAYLTELESFPEGNKDQVDATSGAFAQCVRVMHVATTSQSRATQLGRAPGGF
jgi:predicted phage terminase large subunit-like protein